MKNARLRRQVPNAGTEALAILDPSRGVIEPPIRAEIFSASRFQEHGRSLGETHAAKINAPRSAAFFPRLHANIAVLREAYRYIGLQERSGHHVSPAGEWLLDNFHIVVAQIKQIHDGLPRGYFRDLPVLTDAHLAGLPRVYGVAWAFIAHTDSAFDETLLVEYLCAYQQTRDLTLGELWALPTTMRVVLVENLRRLSERVAVTKAAREVANQWCDRLDEHADVDVTNVFDLMNSRGILRPFALQVLQRVNSDTGARLLDADSERDAVRAALTLAIPNPTAAQIQQQTEESADNLSVSNAITSLQLLGDTQWRELVGRTSALMQLMQGSSTFCAERDDTQDATLHSIERLARKSRTNELSVARELLSLMHSHSTSTVIDFATPNESPSYWLRGAGRSALCRALGVRAGAIPQWSVVLRRVALPAYLATVVLGSLGLTLWFVTHHATQTTPIASFVLLAWLALWPASETVIAVVNRLISESVLPRRLPRLALTDGIPVEHRALVVIPAMLTNATNIQALANHLERHYLANSERNVQFALLTDYADADTSHCKGDAVLLGAAAAAMDALESRYPPAADATRRFLLLHRERRWAETEQCWIGWERKRGKLEQLIELLALQGESPFIDLGERSRPAANIPYVITLDSDTVLPPGTLRELVGIAAHPMNHPRIDTTLRRIVAGYGILQPRIATPLPMQNLATPFHWLFAGQCGVDPYSVTTSEVYQDLFDEGTFTGKGLLNVNAMQNVLTGRLPEGQVLSHDLIEGAIARCGGVNDITLIEDAPLDADVAASRVRRWTRGDWQLLPLLLRARHYGLCTINRWKIVDNLRRSLVAPFSVALIVAALIGGPISPIAALALVCAAFGAGPMLGAIAGLAPSRDDIALRHFFHHAFSDVSRATGGMLWNVTQLVEHALLLCNAIGTAVYRMLISQRGLLQWTTTASAQSAVRHDLAGLARRHLPVTLVAVGLLVCLLYVDTRSAPLAVALCSLWASAPLWTWWASRTGPAVHRAHRIETANEADRDYLLGVARDSWRLFERHVDASSHYLPPDNVQTVPHMMVAQRTSPTNIGLYLLATACARRFGWIDTPEMLTRCEQTLATLRGLPRHRGHFLNWYDTLTLAPLPPTFVSTVDSGNLCGHLIALAGACDEMRRESSANSGTTRRLLELERNCRRLAIEPDFRFLYDRRRRLFRIGYRVAEQQLDRSSYDLLASESRLASIWAIAKGDVPVSHWAALGRPFYAIATDVGLRSWSGSMFEYLMPSLVLDEPRGSALACASRAALREQMTFVNGLEVPRKTQTDAPTNVPWGISESAYAAYDDTLAYQYAPQGVPRLALRRTPPDELVVAPYASALAAMFDPRAAADNLRGLEDLQARRAMGFVEALDFTAERQAGKKKYTVVSTFMAHHQGMTIVSLANLLLSKAPRRWCMSDPRIGAVDSLLQERVPREISDSFEPPPGPSRDGVREPVHARGLVPGSTALQPTHLLSNGRYSVSLRANGAGWSRFGAADVSRWRDDALRDAHGTFLYVRRNPAASPVSITQHPAPDPAATYHANFHADRVELDAQWSDLRTRCTVWVSAEDDVELRRIELWNSSAQPIRLELMSMFEVSLMDARADEMHPAFANLFVRADWDAKAQALHFVRKPRLVAEDGLYAVHFIAHAEAQTSGIRAQADRGRWLGRNREAAHPLARYDSSTLETEERATGLDPLASLSMQISVPAHGTAQVTIGTAAATSRAVLESLVERYRQPSIIERSSLMSATFIGIRLREMRIHADELLAVQTLTTALTLLLSRPEQPDGTDACDQRELWRFGISGDRPLIVVGVNDLHGMRLVRSLVQAMRLWSWGALTCDLVVVNSEARSYQMPLQLDLVALRERYAREVIETEPARACRLNVLHADELSTVERATLMTFARLRLEADGRPLSHHVQELVEWHNGALDTRRERSAALVSAVPRAATDLPPCGEFHAADGFRFDVTPTSRPLRPWINVIANPQFGAQVSESGAGFTWAGNSRLHQLTSWSNDPITDASGEAIFLQDLRTREVWSVGSGAGAADVVYCVTHTQGSTSISHRRGTLDVNATWCVDCNHSAKHVRIALRNTGTQTLRIRVVGLFEWVMGAQRSDRLSVQTNFESLAFDEAHRLDVLFATQINCDGGFGGSTAFVTMRNDASADASLDEWTCDRRELFDSAGTRVIPDRLGKLAGVGLDPCAAIAGTLMLAPGEARECVIIVGHAANLTDARALAHSATANSATLREVAAHARWNELLNTVTVATPDPLFDALVNRWLLYQTLSCRLWARAGFYQAGGAFGFRDQLQDAMAMAVPAPDLLRAQLLLAASRQFVEGDVQHWWHPPTGAGVRTRFSDDLLWLAHATAHYVDVSGDDRVLDEPVPFLEGESIPVGAEDAYFIPNVSQESATLYEHCARAIDHSLAVGAHGLPLMGGGDWNDGMNRVGIEGRGESVWLAWFLYRLVSDFAPIARRRDDLTRVNRWETAAHGWHTALKYAAWDGEWFVRAFFDDGSPLGSHASTECRIDLVAQTWSVLSGAATLSQQRSSMAAVSRLLIDDAHGLIRILDPPLATARPDAGYIQAYPPGVRENGSQYSHAGVWALMAQASLGDADAAYRSFTYLSPAHRSANAEQCPAYALEPYAMAGDVYTQAPYIGRGGWSWYTGAAGWMHRAAIQSICGLRVRGGSVCITPHLPSHWPEIRLTLQRAGQTYEFVICAASADAKIAQALERGAVPLQQGDWLALADTGGANCRLVIVTRDEERTHVAHSATVAS